MKDNTTAYLVLGAAAFFLLTKRGQSQPTYNYPPPPPPQQGTGGNWAMWINTILNSASDVADLWKPGGPFHNPTGLSREQNEALEDLRQQMLNSGSWWI